jgi:hypothetical protein
MQDLVGFAELFEGGFRAFPVILVLVWMQLQGEFPGRVSHTGEIFVQIFV